MRSPRIRLHPGKFHRRLTFKVIAMTFEKTRILFNSCVLAAATVVVAEAPCYWSTVLDESNPASQTPMHNRKKKKNTTQKINKIQNFLYRYLELSSSFFRFVSLITLAAFCAILTVPHRTRGLSAGFGEGRESRLPPDILISNSR